MTRYEIKMVLPESDLPRARAELQLLPAALRRLHPARVVQSIYFDSHDGAAVNESLAGVSVRHKLRWRWYGDAVDSAVGQFECKRRVSGVGMKDVRRMAAPMAIVGTSRRQFMRELTRRLPQVAADQLSRAEPVQWIRYHREYLGSADGDLRVTLDSRLIAFDQRFGARLQCNAATPLPRVAVIEVKADQRNRAAIEAMLQGVDLRPGRCSKFMIASCPADVRLMTRWADE